jgi:hypothetical protein
MTLILNGTDNSATTPAVTGTDTDTGIYYPTSNQVAIATAGTQAMLVDGNQNVGINAATPGYKLDVAASDTTAGFGYAVRLRTNATAAAVAIQFTDNPVTTQLGALGMDTSSNMKFYTGGTERMRIDSSGNVLVGTTSNIPANAKIFAKGNGVGIAVGYGTGGAEYRHLYMNNGDGSLYFFNDTNYASLSAAGSWTNASDARLKKNIVDIKYGLADVLRMHPRSYQMNAVNGDFVGFIAQELKEVIPEVVSGDPEKQLGVDYGSLVAVAFKAIQEQQVLITSLTARIAALEGTPA